MFEFLVIWFAMNTLVVFQGIEASADGYLSQKQMKAKGINNGWSFLEHGGMWGDFFFISSVVALIVNSYELPYFSFGGRMILLASIIFSLVCKYAFSLRGRIEPEAHTHDGRTTVAGWIHGVYEVLGYWIIPMFLLTPITPRASARDLVIVALALTVHLPLGVIKFNPRWKMSPAALIQTVLSVSAVWLIVIVKLIHR